MPLPIASLSGTPEEARDHICALSHWAYAQFVSEEAKANDAMLDVLCICLDAIRGESPEALSARKVRCTREDKRFKSTNAKGDILKSKDVVLALQHANEPRFAAALYHWLCPFLEGDEPHFDPTWALGFGNLIAAARTVLLENSTASRQEQAEE